MDQSEQQQRTHAEILALHAMAVADIAFFKQQQWQVANYGLLLYVAIIGTHGLVDILTNCEYLFLWLAALAILLSSLYVLADLEKSLAKGRDRLPYARRLFTTEAQAAFGLGDPNVALMPANERSTLRWLLSAVLVFGFVLVSWLLARFWSAGA